MLGEYSTIKIIQTLLSNPNEVFTLRSLAKLSGSSKDSASKALNFMKERNMVSFSVIGPTHQYQANLQNPLARQWKILFNINELTESKLIEEILSKIPNVNCALVYGSLAKGTNDNNSDLDLLIIVNQKINEKPQLGKSINREINPLFLDMNEWRQLSKKDKVFYDNVLLDSIVLIGRKPVIL